MHQGGAWAGGGYKRATKIQKRIDTLISPTVLDYGAGNGSLRKALKNCTLFEYDPGVPGKDALPNPADIVVCIDVAEHIEPDKLQVVLSHIFSLTKVMAYFVIATRPAEKRLPDDRNAHLIIDNAPWWRKQLLQFPWYIKMSNVDDSEYSLWLQKE